MSQAKMNEYFGVFSEFNFFTFAQQEIRFCLSYNFQPERRIHGVLDSVLVLSSDNCLIQYV